MSLFSALVRRRALPILALIPLLALSLAPTLRAAQPFLTVDLDATGTSPLTVRVNQEPVTLTPNQWVASHGLRLQLGASSSHLTVETISTHAVIQVSGFSGWSASLSNQSQAIIGLDRQAKVLDLKVPAKNVNPMKITLPDGATAQAGPGSELRFDLFHDGTYSLSGDGPAEVWNSDGAKIQFGRNRPPMAGGPLITRKQGATVHLERMAPTVDLVLTGTLGNALSVQAGKQRFVIESSGKLEISLTNGSTIFLEQDLTADTVRWEVKKGDFRLSIEGIPGWKTIARTGQGGELVWDMASRTIDLKNTGTAQPLLVSLPHDAWGQVAPKATFQFTHVHYSTFATAAYGGAVSLFNARTDDETDLVPANLLFKSGVPVSKTISAVVVEKKVALSWQRGSPLLVNGVFGVHTLLPGTTKILRDQEHGALEISYSSELVTLTAREGAFQINPDVIGTWTCHLPEGNSISFSLRPGGKTFAMRASAENISAVEVQGPEGSTALLQPGGSLQFLSRAGALASNPQGAIIFLEGEGADQRSSFGLAPAHGDLRLGARAAGFAQVFDQIDLSRISQPPVTAVR